jgi:4-amino-4-deoxy-L-arabinose transferase-like glycosyltransferase
MVRQSAWFVPSLILGFFILSHLFRLAALPVFADESIYIRWTQLIMDDWRQYLFFPMNDGKTPLHMWLMLPFQYLFSDQLWAGRFLSVVVGFFQVLLIGQLIRTVGGRRKTAWLGMLLTTILPFWFFHHRMALIDALLTLWLSLIVLATLKIVKNTQSLAWGWIGLSGLALGLALLTKVPAILIAPALALYPLWPAQATWQQRLRWYIQIGVAGGIGVIIFASLYFAPAFGQLFSRGSDFLFPWQEVLLAGKWRETIINFPTYFWYFVTYLTAPIMFFVATGLFSPARKRTHHLMFWSAMLLLAPMVLLGRQVYPRYLFPAALFFTIGAALAFEELLDRWVNRPQQVRTKTLTSLVMAVLVTNIIGSSSTFILSSWFNPNQTPFVSSDKTQYLYEWSSGHGIKPAVQFIQEAAQTQKIAVATEGTFGTLPDGILLYLHRQDLQNIYVEGIGQPVTGIPQFFSNRAKQFDQVVLVVNSHRMKMNLPAEKLLKEYCRPAQAPCLQIWDITEVVKTHQQSSG